MDRRSLLKASLLLSASALPAAQAARPVALQPLVPSRRKSAGELIFAGVPIVGVTVSLIDSLVYPVRPDVAHFGNTISFADIPSHHLCASNTATNVTIQDGWLKADDVTFMAVTGNQSNLLISLLFEDGSNPILSVIESLFFGLPVTPNGGNIHLAWPREGIVRLS